MLSQVRSTEVAAPQCLRSACPMQLLADRCRRCGFSTFMGVTERHSLTPAQSLEVAAMLLDVWSAAGRLAYTLLDRHQNSNKKTGRLAAQA